MERASLLDWRDNLLEVVPVVGTVAVEEDGDAISGRGQTRVASLTVAATRLPDHLCAGRPRHGGGAVARTVVDHVPTSVSESAAPVNRAR